MPGFFYKENLLFFTFFFSFCLSFYFFNRLCFWCFFGSCFSFWCRFFSNNFFNFFAGATT